jgi:uncharacterized protein (TIGR00251 family)
LADIFKINESKTGLTFEIHVTPCASRATITSFQEGALKLKVTAPPAEGAANIACIKLLSEALKLRKSQMEILAGAKSRRKIVLVKNMTKKELEAKMEKLRELLDYRISC